MTAKRKASEPTMFPTLKPAAARAHAALVLTAQDAADLGHRIPCSDDPEPYTGDAPEPDVLAEACRRCLACPALEACRTYADAAPERWGVWGGTWRGPKRAGLPPPSTTRTTTSTTTPTKESTTMDAQPATPTTAGLDALRAALACEARRGHLPPIMPASPDAPVQPGPSRNVASPELVAYVRQLRQEEPTLLAVAERLNAEGVRTVHGRSPWRISTVASLLKSRRRAA